MYKYIFYFFLISLIYLVSCKNDKNLPIIEKVAEMSIPKYEYGINVDSLLVIKEQVKKNEFLADILLRYGVNYQTIDHIARFTKDTFDVRRIRKGNNYTVLCTNDSIQKALYFIYEVSDSEFVLYHLSDSVFVSKGQKTITMKLESISGEIKTSLWNSMVDQEADPNLANELSEIYAWTIDFFGLRKGDAFKAVYEQYYVEDKYIGLGKIIAARFHHLGEDHNAFYFEQNGAGDYFDEEGNSLQRTFLKAPLRFTRISSRFSHSRMHPVLKIRRPHHGIDYAAPAGTPVFTVGDGVVIEKGYQKRGGGYYIKIKHNGTYSTSYMHFSGYAKGMKTGKKVKQGDLIGYVGNTGLSTGPHLDFRFYRNGKAVNPLKVESPPSKPIDTSYQVEFDSIVHIYLNQLEAIR